MSTSLTLTIVNVAAWVAYLAGCLRGVLSRTAMLAVWCAANVALLVSAIVLSSGWASYNGGCAVTAVLLILWYRRRGKRKRALRELGAKSRARLAALVTALRERTRPRRVLRPVPQGGLR